MSTIVFNPLNEITATTFFTFVICAVLFGALLGYSLIKSKKVLSLLAFIGFIIFGGSSLMNYLANGKMQEIVISKSEIQCVYGTFKFSELVGSQIITRGLFGGGQGNERLLEISIRQQPPVLFSASTYPIDSIKMVLDKRVAAWWEQEQVSK